MGTVLHHSATLDEQITQRCALLDRSGVCLWVNEAGDVKIFHSFHWYVLETLWEPSVCSRQDTAAAPSNATARWPWECRAVASFWQHDKSLNQRTGPTPPHTSKNAPRGASWEGDAVSSSARSDGVKMHNVTECVLLCACSVKGEDREARELMKWLHSGREGKGASCWTAGRNHHCLTQFYNAQ